MSKSGFESCRGLFFFLFSTRLTGTRSYQKLFRINFRPPCTPPPSYQGWAGWIFLYPLISDFSIHNLYLWTAFDEWYLKWSGVLPSCALALFDFLSVALLIFQGRIHVSCLTGSIPHRHFSKNSWEYKMSRKLNKAFLVIESDPLRYARDPPGAYIGLVLNWPYRLYSWTDFDEWYLK